CDEKVSVPGVSDTDGAGVTPFPVRARNCGLSSALSARRTLAFRVPAADGAKSTVIVHDALVARVAGASGQLLLRSKSPCVSALFAMLVIVSGAVPVLVSVEL